MDNWNPGSMTGASLGVSEGLKGGGGECLTCLGGGKEGFLKEVMRELSLKKEVEIYQMERGTGGHPRQGEWPVQRLRSIRVL